MALYRNALPQLCGGLYLTDGGIETTLIFNEGFELPDFAAFLLLEEAKGQAALRNYFRSYADIATGISSWMPSKPVNWQHSQATTDGFNYQLHPRPALVRSTSRNSQSSTYGTMTLLRPPSSLNVAKTWFGPRCAGRTSTTSGRSSSDILTAVRSSSTRTASSLARSQDIPF